MNKAQSIKTDVLIIGGGPAGLSAAIRLADILKSKGLERDIMVIEKGSAIGSHTLSGAVIRPEVFRELLPDSFEQIPFDSKVAKSGTLFLTARRRIKSPVHAPYMGNKGNYTASLGAVCRFLAEQAAQRGVGVYPGFAMSDILYDRHGNVCGAKAIDTGVDQGGKHMANFQAGTRVEASITIFAEGSRGSLTKKLIDKFDLQNGRNPQMYSLGCKEVWSVKEGSIAPGEVYHSLGYPLSLKEFGGGFVYGLKDNKAAVGLVVGLDYADPSFDIHAALQVYKQHKSVRKILEGGKLLEYGAKTLPEGGLYSLPRLYAGGALIVGDSAGFLAMPALKGVHLAVRSGMLAAETAADALAAGDFAEKSLSTYETKVMESNIYKELRPVRNFRQGFSKGLIRGGIRFAAQLISGGAGFCGRLRAHDDKDTTKTIAGYKGKPFKERFGAKLDFDKVLTFDKVTDIYFSGVAHDELQVPHLHVNNPATFKTVNIAEYGAPRFE